MDGKGRGRDLTTGRRLVLLLAVAVVVAPMVLGAADALASDWAPFGDEAALGVRADDVLSAQSPLLGMPASSVLPGDLPHHPGPMLFWWYAPFVAAGGIATGLVVGAAALATASAVAIVVMTFRREGLATALGAALVTVLLIAALFGAAPIVSPLNADVVLLPLLLVCFLSWWIAGGERRLIPVAIVVASLVAQAYLTYLPVAAGALTVAAGFLVADRWRHRAPVRASAVRPRRRWRAPSLVAAQLAALGVLAVALAVAMAPWIGPPLVAVVAGVAIVAGAVLGLRRWVLPSRTRTWSLVAVAVCWTVPAAEALVNAGGNVRDLWHEARAPAPSTGLGGGWNAAIASIALPPPVGDHLREALLSSPSVGLGIVGIALGVALAAWAARRRSRHDLALLLVAAGAVAFGAASVAGAPAEDAWIPVRFNWVLVVSAFWSFALVRTALVWAAVRWPSVAARPTVRAAVGVAATVVLLNSLPQALSLDDNYEPWLQDAVDTLGGQLTAESRPTGRVLVLDAGGLPYWELARGLTAVVEEEGWSTATEQLVSYFGPARDGRVVPVDSVLHVVPADLPRPPAGGRLVASYRPPSWDATEAREVAVAVRDHLRGGPVTLTAAGADDLHQHLYGVVRGACEPARWQRTDCVGPEAFVAEPDRLVELDPMLLLRLYRAGAVADPVLPAPLGRAVDRVTDVPPVDVYLTPAG